MRTSLLLHDRREASRPLAPVCVLGVRLTQGTTLFYFGGHRGPILLFSPACGNHSDPNLASVCPLYEVSSV